MMKLGLDRNGFAFAQHTTKLSKIWLLNCSQMLSASAVLLIHVQFFVFFMLVAPVSQTGIFRTEGYLPALATLHKINELWFSAKKCGFRLSGNFSPFLPIRLGTSR